MFVPKVLENMGLHLGFGSNLEGLGSYYIFVDCIKFCNIFGNVRLFLHCIFGLFKYSKEK